MEGGERWLVVVLFREGGFEKRGRRERGQGLQFLKTLTLRKKPRRGNQAAAAYIYSFSFPRFSKGARLLGLVVARRKNARLFLKSCLKA